MCIKRQKNQVGNVGMGFDGAATFSGKMTGVQARLKKYAPHAVFVHCHLRYVQAANSTTGIKHVYTKLTTPWKYFHYSPKRAESLKEIQHVRKRGDYPKKLWLIYIYIYIYIYLSVQTVAVHIY